MQERLSGQKRDHTVRRVGFAFAPEACYNSGAENGKRLPSAGGESVARIYTRREVKRRRLNFKIFAGIYDFIGVVVGIAVIVACAFLLAALVNWVTRDGQASFKSLLDIFNAAIIIPK